MSGAKRKTASVPFNFAMNFLLKILGPLCFAVSYAIAFRRIGQAEIGRVAFSASVTSFFLLIAAFGIPTYGIRECARVREDRLRLSRTVYELLIVQLVTTALSELLLLGAVLTVPKLRCEWKLFLIQGSALLFQCLNTEWLLAGLERYGFLTLRALAVRVASVLLVAALVRGPEDYLLYCALTAGTAAAAILLNLLAVRKELVPLGEAGAPAWREHLRPALTFFAQAAAITVYTSLDETLLGFLKGDEIVGAYDAAVKIKLVLSYFITSLGTVLLPRFSYYVGEDRKEEFARGLRLSGNFIWLAAVPLTVFFFVRGEDCLLALFKTAPRETLWSLRLLALTLIPIGLSNLTGLQILTPLGKERIVMRSVVLGALIDLIADLLLIPAYGPQGAALGTLIAELAVLAFQLAAMRTLFPAYALTGGAKKTAVTALAALPLLLLLPLAPIGPWPTVLLGALLYFGVVYGALLLMGDPILRMGLERARSLTGRKQK